MRKKKSVSISAELFDWYKERAEDLLVISAAAEIEHALRVYKTIEESRSAHWLQIYTRATSAIHNYKISGDMIALSEIIHNVKMLKEKYFVELRQAKFYKDFLHLLASIDLSIVPETKRGIIQDLFNFL